LFVVKSRCLALRILSSLSVSPNRGSTDSLVAMGRRGVFLTLLKDSSTLDKEFSLGGVFSSLFDVEVSESETALLVSKTSLFCISSESCDDSLPSVTFHITNINLLS